MKLAKVKCAAQSRSTTHRIPDTGNKYRFRAGQALEVDNLEDLRYFDRKGSYSVNWTVRGQLINKLAGEDDSVGEAIDSFSYRAKQELAKGFGINANQSSEELTEELTEVGEDLQEKMELY